MKYIYTNLNTVLFITLSFALAACGGGGGGSTQTNTTPTISSITNAAGYLGLVAASVPQTQNITITGTNFAAGMKLNTGGADFTPTLITPPSQISTSISTSISINAIPTDNYLSVALKSSSGSTLATSGIGVAGGGIGTASADMTVANGIGTLLKNKCGTCHSGANPPGGVDLTNTSLSNSKGVINILSSACSTKYRVVAGDRTLGELRGPS